MLRHHVLPLLRRCSLAEVSPHQLVARGVEVGPEGENRAGISNVAVGGVKIVHQLHHGQELRPLQKVIGWKVNRAVGPGFQGSQVDVVQLVGGQAAGGNAHQKVAAVICDLGANHLVGVIRGGVYECVLLLRGAHDVQAELLIEVDVGLCSKVHPILLRGLIAVVEQPRAIMSETEAAELYIGELVLQPRCSAVLLDHQRMDGFPVRPAG
mmetsp:Transcript_25826/g.72322  ORF Transcript_25826/g.72322 Transcript_25826/m.72322 type:complete len:210 (+) Transcript_25826:1406-2035(+)